MNACNLYIHILSKTSEIAHVHAGAEVEDARMLSVVQVDLDDLDQLCGSRQGKQAKIDRFGTNNAAMIIFSKTSEIAYVHAGAEVEYARMLSVVQVGPDDLD